MWSDAQIVFLAIILPFFFAGSLILEGMVKRRTGRGGKAELILGNIFVILILVAAVLMLLK